MWPARAPRWPLTAAVSVDVTAVRRLMQRVRPRDDERMMKSVALSLIEDVAYL
jgi:hypothetical protein